jgi:lipid A 3-O-deacylase
MSMQFFRRGAAWCSLIGLGTALVILNASAQGTNSEPRPESAAGLEAPKPSIWENGIGNGFRAGAQSLSLLAGAGNGVAVFGAHEQHDLALFSLAYGHMLSGVKGEGHWWRGNWELRGELFAGAEFSPDTHWVVGLAPHLRYNFATGHRWVPFFDIGAGVTGAGIREPDLGGTFEFNLQAGGGVHWFVRDNLAVTLEGKLLHISSAGIYQPNNGVNTLMGMVGVTWFF